MSSNMIEEKNTKDVDNNAININDNNIEEKKDNIMELKEENNELKKIDIVFILDCTGSMSPYIESARDNIVAIANKIESECKNCDPSFALVLYRDIPKSFDINNPQDNINGFITEIFQFTSIPLEIELKLHSVDALGGGDQPECLTSALYSCLHQLNWNKDSIKIIIIITDAPPHGLESKVHDDYPNGDLNTFIIDKEGNIDQETKYLNILDIIKLIRNKLKASIYSVVCEPNISCDFDFAHDFYSYISETTNGKFLPLSKAELLPNVIVGTVKQQISIHDLSQQLKDDIKNIKQEYNNKISNAQLNKIIKEKWKNKHVKKRDISIGTLYRKQRPKDNINLLLNAQKIQTLKDFKKNAIFIPRYTLKDFRHINKNITAIGNKSEHIELSSDGTPNPSKPPIQIPPLITNMKKSFDDLLVSGHDIDGIGQFYASLSVSKNFDVPRILFTMLVKKKSRHIGVWRERYLVLFKNGILKTFKSKAMKTSTETINVNDISAIIQNQKKFEITQFHIVCDKITFKFKAKNIGNKKQLISEIKCIKRGKSNYNYSDTNSSYEKGNKNNYNVPVHNYPIQYNDMNVCESLSMESQRAYSIERSVGSGSLQRMVRMNRNSVSENSVYF